MPPSAQGVEDLRMRAIIGQFRDVNAVVYISTSGVYGDCGGDWVDESRTPAPLTDRAKRRLDAEQQLQSWAQTQNVRLVILRVPGIYGPGRLPIKRLQQAQPILDPALAPFSNRIHADDLATAVELALQQGHGIYNISDGTPDSMSRYFLLCAAHLGLPTPALMDWAQAEATFSPAMLSFYRESRRLNIEKARIELGFTPRYPSLLEGLAAC